MNTFNENQNEITRAIKAKLNEALSSSGLTMHKLRESINEKYDCDLNKDTFRKLFSYENLNLNCNCLIFVCKYLNIDMNELCLHNELNFLSKTKPIILNLEVGEYYLFLGSNKNNHHRLFVHKEPDGEYTLFILNEPERTHRNMVCGYHSTRIIANDFSVEVYFGDIKSTSWFVLHFNNDKLKSANLSIPFLYTGLITMGDGTLTSKFLLLKVDERDLYWDKREYYLSLLKNAPDRLLVKKDILDNLYNKDTDVKYLIDSIKSIYSVYTVDNCYYFDATIFNEFRTKTYIDSESISPYRDLDIDKIERGYLRVCYYSENDDSISAKLANFQWSYLLRSRNHDRKI